MLRHVIPATIIGSFALWPTVLVARTLTVNRTHAAAADDNPGTDQLPLKTINRAAQLAQPGDTVLVRAGVYRERVAPARGGRPHQPIVYTAAPGELVVIKGSEVWQPDWKRLRPEKHVYRGTLDAALFQNERIHPYRTRLKGMPAGKQLTLGQVFVDGRPWREVDTEAELWGNSATWLVTDGGTALSVHFSAEGPPPGERLVEITVRERIFAPHRRNLGYIHVKGFTMEHCANQFPEKFWHSDSPQAGALGCRAGHHWLIEGNTVRLAKSIGIDCGYEGRHDLEGSQPTPRHTGFHLLRNNIVVDNGCCGIAGMRSIGTQIVGNVIQRNNRNHHVAYESGGIKVHHFVDGVIDGNFISDNDEPGIWLDNVYQNARVTRNLVTNNRRVGILIELGEGPVFIDNNVVANSRPGLDELRPGGDGIHSHDASGINLEHNLIFGNHRFGAFHRKVTRRPRSGVSRIKIFNNIFIDNKAGRINMPLAGLDARDNLADYNLFGPGGDFVVSHWGGISADLVIRRVQREIGRQPRLWNDQDPQLDLDDWRRVMRFGAHSLDVAEAEAQLSADFVLTLNLGKAPSEIPSQPLLALDRDFVGNPIPQQGARVGPFQQIATGTNRFKLWPRGASTTE